jgi:YspA, cpYpsA-related SLOG family
MTRSKPVSPSPDRFSPTARVIEELQIHGYHAHEDEPDPRPLPDADQLDQGLDLLFEGLSAAITGSRFEDDLDDLAWHLADLFHRKANRVQRSLDENEDRQRRSQREQDGSEVRSVELERLIAEGQTLLERRQVFEYLRDRAGEHYELLTGSAWRPRAGSLVNHAKLTASLLESREYLSAKRRAETEVHLPKGTRIAFSGGTTCNDHKRIWQLLDETLAHYPGMVLLHGGTPRGAERIAACWADNRKVTQITFKPDWDRDGKAAPFKRNDALLAEMPQAVIVFPGTGITDNLADKAKRLGIRILDHRKEAGA